MRTSIDEITFAFHFSLNDEERFFIRLGKNALFHVELSDPSRAVWWCRGARRRREDAGRAP